MINAQHPEISAVDVCGAAPVLGSTLPGLKVRMHSGRTITVHARQVAA